GATTMLCVLSVFTGRSMSTKYFIMGIVMLWVGCWVSGVTLKTFGFDIGGSNTPGDNGYHYVSVDLFKLLLYR
ncbi:MAG: hypothetical protein ACW97V_19020, partial [Promethearchaeota archaeon]